MDEHDLASHAVEMGRDAARDYIGRGEEQPPGLVALPPGGPGPVSLTRVIKQRMGQHELTPSQAELREVHEAWTAGVRTEWEARHA
jgi:hypothetical protein